MRYYCTLFDSNYLPHAMSLADSLRKWSDDFTLIMFCMDDAAYQHVVSLGMPDLLPISGDELDRRVAGLPEARANRSRVEYFYTCSPAICYYSVNYIGGVDEITYLDADLYFFNSPEPIFEEIGDKSIGIIEHRFARRQRRRARYGRFNVAWITFRADDEGTACLNRWLFDCIAWCYQRLEDGKYADQKYLDQWPDLYRSLHVISHPGANVAPWNIGDYKLSMRSNVVYVNDSPLIFYHFADFRQVGANHFRTGLSAVRVKTSGVLKDQVYTPYARSIMRFMSYDRRIASKPATHVRGLKSHVRALVRALRGVRYPDVITINPGVSRTERS